MSAARQALDSTITEKDFQQQVYDFARMRGWMAYHVLRSKKSTPGFPDLVLVRGEFLLFPELKTTRGKLSQAQQDWQEALARIPGGHVVPLVWRPGDWPLIERILT